MAMVSAFARLRSETHRIKAKRHLDIGPHSHLPPSFIIQTHTIFISTLIIHSLSLSLSRTVPTPSMAANSIAFFFFFLLLLLLFPFYTPFLHASPINTIVVLVMENRSFDHMLGWMKKLNPEINGVNGSESNLLSTTDPNSKRFFFQDQSHYVDPDPGHSFQAIREQIFGSDNTSANPPPMNGFAQQAFSMDNTSAMSRDVMNGFLPDKVAVYNTLVSEFAVFDR